MTLDELVAKLRVVHEADLRAVVLYGSAATDQHVATRSDYNVLVLVEQLPVSSLHAEAEAMRSWTSGGNAPPLTLTVSEWQASADVFPMEYSDILARHRVLFGIPPFERTTVRPGDLRLELEREAMGKLIQLRQGILAVGGDPALEAELLSRAFGTFMAIFRGLLRLHGEEPPAEHVAVARAAAARAGFDAAPFVRVHEHRTGSRALTPKEIPGVLEGYVRGAARLAEYVDAEWRAAEGRPDAGLGARA